MAWLAISEPSSVRLVPALSAAGSSRPARSTAGRSILASSRLASAGSSPALGRAPASEACSISAWLNCVIPIHRLQTRFWKRSPGHEERPEHRDTWRRNNLREDQPMPARISSPSARSCTKSSLNGAHFHTTLRRFPLCERFTPAAFLTFDPEFLHRWIPLSRAASPCSPPTAGSPCRRSCRNARRFERIFLQADE